MGSLPLEGLRVADFSWVLAGPFAAKMLADQGAQVIKIETHYKLDGIRNYGPWRERVPTPPDGSGFFDIHNRNKLAITLNLNTPLGVDICKRLIKISDVAIENYSVRAMKKFGLEYPVLREVNPGLIMVSMAGMGQTGPHREYLSFGPTLQPLIGLTHLTGFPNGEPVGIGNSYPDFVAALHATFAILAALEYRARTGEGQYIDLSQYETGVSVLGSMILDYTANGRAQGRIGNRHPTAAPHGCYRCQGKERWCVIAVFTDEEWRSFGEVLESPPWTQETRFATTQSRVAHADELDGLVEAWTINYTPEEVMGRLQAAGVPAGVVQNTEDLMTRDPQMKERGFYQAVEHLVAGETVLEGVPFRFSGGTGGLRTAAPIMGQHNDYVFRDILGLTPQEMEAGLAQGAFS
ncbi:MAG: CoA transferase [Chloroflexi bacterium]|nr:CoA transferase [Chloroflexota bacterium]